MAAGVMAFRASSTARQPSLPHSPPLSPPPNTSLIPSKVKTFSRSHQLTPGNSLSLPAAAILPLFTLFSAPNEARAKILPKEEIVSTLTQVESIVDQIQELGSNIFSAAGQVIGAVVDAVKPGLDAALPGGEAVKVASPVVSEASKKAQEAIQSSGIDTEPVVTAAKIVADAAQQTTKVFDEAKPIATSTVETIFSTEPAVIILGTGGVLVIVYLLLPPIFSAISFINLRGYQGHLTPAQTLDLMSTKNYILIDIRSEKDKDKAGVPRLPSSAKNKLLSIPVKPQDSPGIGELALGPLMFGSSSTLLNADHHDIYFKHMPVWNPVLRRHGDLFEHTSRGYYRAHGRADDTMNLGGIKVSSIEIERICNAVNSSILETAAVGVPPPGGGPERLVIAVVFKDHDKPLSDLTELAASFNSALQKKLNPLFKVSDIVPISSLPRTASNKVMRRVLRQQFSQIDQNSKL